MKKTVTAFLGVVIMMLLLIPGIGVYADGEPAGIDPVPAPTYEEFRDWNVEQYYWDMEGYPVFNSFYYDSFPEDGKGNAKRALYEDIRAELIMWEHEIGGLSIAEYFSMFLGNKYLDYVINTYEPSERNALENEFEAEFETNKEEFRNGEYRIWQEKIGGDIKLYNGSELRREYYIKFLESKGHESYHDYYEKSYEALFGNYNIVEFVDGVIPKDKRVAFEYKLSGKTLNKNEVTDVVEMMLLDCPYLIWDMGDVVVEESGTGYSIRFIIDEFVTNEDDFYFYFTEGLYNEENWHPGFLEGCVYLYSEKSEELYYSAHEELCDDDEVLYEEAANAFVEYMRTERSVRPPYAPMSYHMSNPEAVWSIVSWIYRSIMVNYDIVADQDANWLEKTILPYADNYEYPYNGKKTASAYAKLFSECLSTQHIKNYIARGTYDGKPHYWNVICLGEEDGEEIWYQCDTVLDDLGGMDYFAGPIHAYSYFLIPADKFNGTGTKDHNPKDAITAELCGGCNSYEWTYAYRCASYDDNTLTEETLDDFISAAEESTVEEYVYYLSTNSGKAEMIARKLGLDSSAVVRTPAGWEVRYRYADLHDPAAYMENYITVTEIVRDEYKIDNETKYWYYLQDGNRYSLIGESFDPVVIEIPRRPEDYTEFTQYDWNVTEINVRTALITGEKREPGAKMAAHDFPLVTVDDPEVVKVSLNYDMGAVLTPLVDGTVTVTIASYLAPELKQSFTIKIGTGIKGSSKPNPTPDYVIWAGGTKDMKSVTVNAGVTASTWTDDKGKSKNGKLMWIAMKDKTTPVFDAKHTLKTKSDAKSIASVSGKGVVSAKSAGFVYVYAIDTGSETWKEYVVEVKQAATKVVCKDAPKGTAVKKLVVEAASNGSLYIVPEVKNSTASKECTYKVELAKSEYADKLSLGTVTDEDGVISFTYTGLKANGTKAASVKINIINIESNKKCSVTVQVVNPVKSVNPSSIDNSALMQKNGTCEFVINLAGSDGTNTTTDKLKVYVSSSKPTVSGTKVSCTASKDIKATLSKDGSKVTLKAAKDNPGNVGIYLACTNSASKTVTIYKIGEAGSTPAPAEE